MSSSAGVLVYGIITQWDEMVGRIVSRLKSMNLIENTVIVIMSDHGQMLGDHWLHGMPPTHLDGVLRVPCIWYCPSIFKHAQINDALISHLDFAPTVLDIAGVPIPEENIPPEPEAVKQRHPWPGKSFFPLLKGEKKKIQESVIAENQDSSWTANINTRICNVRRSTLSMPSSSSYDYSHFLYGQVCSAP